MLRVGRVRLIAPRAGSEFFVALVREEGRRSGRLIRVRFRFRVRVGLEGLKGHKVWVWVGRRR